MSIRDAAAPARGARPAGVYSLYCVFSREVANRLLAEICSGLNAADRESSMPAPASADQNHGL